MRLLPSSLQAPLRWFRRTVAVVVAVYAVAGFVALRLGPAPATVDGRVFALGGGGDRAGELQITQADLPPVGVPVPTAGPAPLPAVGPGALPAGADGPSALPSPVAPAASVVRGALSVHTERSHDAEGTLEEVGAAARRTKLDFVILGDHPGPWMEEGARAFRPRVLADVLVVPGLELVVAGTGRTLAVGLDTATALWEGSLEALTRRADSLGGFLSVVHPRSPRARERWTGADAGTVHAWESLDISEMARMSTGDIWLPHRVVSLLGGMAVGGGQGTLARMWRNGTRTPALLSYDSARAVRPVALTGGLNHHPKARLGSLLFPHYEPFFRTVVNHVTVEGGLGGDPVEARGRLLNALRKGRLFVTLGDSDGARGFDVYGSNGGDPPAPMGGRTGWRPGSALHVQLPPDGPERTLVRLVGDGGRDLWLEVEGRDELAIPVESPGIYRVEVFRPGLPLGPWRFDLRPWILSNPVEFYPAD